MLTMTEEMSLPFSLVTLPDKLPLNLDMGETVAPGVPANPGKKTCVVAGTTVGLAIVMYPVLTATIVVEVTEVGIPVMQ